jgi:hypothetical protein
MSFLPLYVYFIAISFLVSLVVYFNRTPSFKYLRIFPPFLFGSLVVEVVGSYFSSIGRNNVILYDVFSTIEFCFYLWIISILITDSRVKLIARLTIPVYVIITTLNVLYFQGPRIFHTATYSLGCLLIVIFCIYYFYELFRNPKSVKLNNSPEFWICSGLLFFYCCGFPLYGFLNYWGEFIRTNFILIFTILNIFLYSLFTIAFLCVRTRRYTLSSS